VLESLVVEATTHEAPECLSLGGFFVAVQYKSAFRTVIFRDAWFPGNGAPGRWRSALGKPGLEAPLALILGEGRVPPAVKPRRFPPPWSIEDIGAAAGLLETANQIEIILALPLSTSLQGRRTCLT
jgi:hypothetical protein